MREPDLLDEIISLQKLNLSPSIESMVEEAAQLLADGRTIEAEALIENAKARARALQQPSAPPRSGTTAAT